MLQHSVKIMEVSQHAEDRWCETITAKSRVNLDYIRECTPSENHLNPTYLSEVTS